MKRKPKPTPQMTEPSETDSRAVVDGDSLKPDCAPPSWIMGLARLVLPKCGVVKVYQAKDGWRWHAKALNNRIVSESAESYVNRSEAMDAAERWGPWRFAVDVQV